MCSLSVQQERKINKIKPYLYSSYSQKGFICSAASSLLLSFSPSLCFDLSYTLCIPPPTPSLTQGLLSGCREEVELSEVMDDYQPSAVFYSAPLRFTQPPTTRHENQSLFIFLSLAHSFFSLCYLSIYFLCWLLPSSIILSFFDHR